MRATLSIVFFVICCSEKDLLFMKCIYMINVENIVIFETPKVVRKFCFVMLRIGFRKNSGFVLVQPKMSTVEFGWLLYSERGYLFLLV